jgi:hypothetical protein
MDEGIGLETCVFEVCTPTLRETCEEWGTRKR